METAIKVEVKQCHVCGKDNTEFFKITKQQPLDNVYDRIGFGPVTRLKKLIHRYVAKLTAEPLEVSVEVCQGCVSRAFRQFTKGL